MRLPIQFALFVLFATSTAVHADSVLVGTDLSHLVGSGAGLCYNSSDCEKVAEQFTLVDTVVIDQVKVAMNPYFIGYDGSYHGGNFTVNLGSAPGGGSIIGSSILSTPSTQIFDFTGLTITLAPGTYYLTLSGGNVAWTYAPALITAAGTVGPDSACDPTLGCSWYSAGSSPHAFEIDGTISTPEPSTWILLATGLSSAAVSIRNKFRS